MLATATAGSVGAAEPAGLGDKSVEEWADDLDFEYVPQVRIRAARALGRIGPEAASALGPLVAALEDDVEAVRREAAWAIGEIGPAAAPATRYLAELIGDDFLGVRRAAVRSLGRIGPGAAPAVRELESALRDDALAPDILVTLERIGPGARLAAPALRRLARGKDAALAEGARRALAAIEAEPAS